MGHREQVARELVKGKGLPQSLSRPLGGRVRGHIEVQNATPVMRQNQKHVKDLETPGVDCLLVSFGLGARPVLPAHLTTEEAGTLKPDFCRVSMPWTFQPWCRFAQTV